MPADFEKINLTDEEKEIAIFNARFEKYWQWKDEEKRKLEINKRQNALKPFTCDELKKYVLDRNPHFKIDKNVEPLFNMLCQYFSNDTEFEKSGYSLKKGICLIGPVGVGKTELLKLFQSNKRQSFNMITVFEIEQNLQAKGIEYIDSYYGYVPGWGGSEKYFYQKEIGWAFDDVGRDSVVFDFGNKTDALSKIFQTRYFRKMPFNSLHITTNKTADELEKRYDEAVRSRLREMFNYIVYNGSDRRR